MDEGYDLQEQLHEISEKNRDNEYITKAKLQEKDEQIEFLASKQEQLERLVQSFIDSGQLIPKKMP